MKDNKTISFYYRGRWALASILRDLKIEKNDKIALQAYTCTAVPQSISSIGACPLFIDIDNSLNMSIEDLKTKHNSCAPIKAVIVQHTFGIKCNDAIGIFCAKNNIPVIEDCCHIPFTEESFQNRHPSSIAQFYSFEWGKPIPAGIGGSAVRFEKLAHKNTKTKNKVSTPFLKSLKIEIQFLIFKYLYKPSTYFILKKLFGIISKIGIAEGNHFDPKKLLEDSEESKWAMPQGVKKRILSNQKYLGSKQDLYKGSLREKISYLNSVFYQNKFNGLVNINDQILRYPIYVNNKSKVLIKASELKYELGDWYSSPVDPLNDNELEALKWDLSSCLKAYDMSANVVTIPLNEKSDLASIKKTAEWLVNYI